MTPGHIYISGPMRNYKGFNFPAFFEAEATLREQFPDADICNPAREDVVRFGLQACLAVDPTGLTAGLYLQDNPAHAFDEGDLRLALGHDLEYICRYCDLLVLLPGWQKSSGAMAEAATAKALGILVIEYPRASWDAVSDSAALEAEPEAQDTAETLLGRDSPAPYAQDPITGEVRTVSATGGEKGAKLAAFDQISPVVEQLVAEHFGKGARKYAAHNFRKGYAWSLSYSALRRHLADFWAGKEYDVCPPDGTGCKIEHPETGEDTRVKTEHGWTCYNHTGSLHIVAVIWHAMVLTEFFLFYKEYDDRYVHA